MKLIIDELRFDTIFRDYMKKKNIQLQVHYVPVHLQPYYKNNFGFKSGDFPIAEIFYEREFSIPMYPNLTDEDLTYITGAFTDTINRVK